MVQTLFPLPHPAVQGTSESVPVQEFAANFQLKWGPFRHPKAWSASHPCLDFALKIFSRKTGGVPKASHCRGGQSKILEQQQQNLIHWAPRYVVVARIGQHPTSNDLSLWESGPKLTAGSVNPMAGNVQMSEERVWAQGSKWTGGTVTVTRGRRVAWSASLMQLVVLGCRSGRGVASVTSIVRHGSGIWHTETVVLSAGLG
ncbi:hypothetical protein VFPPC_18139 [Pochonia chlamydosporia 170]|uniref:Uncharacterized protein n=1 Tax=Pochonia chlamydosporia 170 TaxID=1380566 RepID=A0A219API0_METCM|nr:hypothetical protein VFPPC_18139 [Pochonia chlamydosporia 170]OWT42726.1 hypothetical protein VFPPC_18139 [Pochonia chlamydosporia 170]